MNLLDRLNGIYSAKSEVPINWLVAARRDALDLFPHFLRLLASQAVNEPRRSEFQRRLGRLFRGLRTSAPADRHVG